MFLAAPRVEDCPGAKKQDDIFRARKQHLTFGLGPHVCIGQHLARIEMERALNLLLDALPNMRFDPDQPAPQIIGLHTRTAHVIPVVFDPH